MGSEAVSSVVGTVLMLGITVTVFGAVSFVVLRHFEQDEGPARAELGYLAQDARFLLRHTGGEPLPLAQGTLLLNLNGFESRVPLSAFAGQLGGDTWRMGDTICVSGPVPPCHYDDVTVRGIVLVHANTVLLTQGQRGEPHPCADDATPPEAHWSKDPYDVSRLTSGPVSVRLLLLDPCPGPDDGYRPVLHWRLDDGSQPAFTRASMTLVAPGEWAATIPAHPWASHVGHVLELYADHYRDINLNVGVTGLHQDIVDDIPPVYVATGTASMGQLADLENARSANDSGAAAILTEGATGSMGTVVLDASSVVSATGWTNAQNAYASDDQYATTSSNTPSPLRLGLQDPATHPGAITSVSVRAEVGLSWAGGDGWRMRACIATACSALSPLFAGSTSDGTISYDMTGLRPGGGPWTWADVQALEVEVVPVKQAARDGTWRVDRAWLEVQHAPTYSAQATFAFSGVPAAATQTLSVRAMATGDTFALQVWDGSVWRQRATLGSPFLLETTYTLTTAEYQGGAPQVRIVDATPGGTAQGVLHIDFLRVVSA
ncbi:MAG TPA: type IV pilin N-terminal domain-containing protein [Candidatus Thermoplasmatota archaeon]|nr:type IV pilin N-terminal domain-containing protein [Candidatus Thermoplasmatota archaeon]